MDLTRRLENTRQVLTSMSHRYSSRLVNGCTGDLTPFKTSFYSKFRVLSATEIISFHGCGGILKDT